MIIKVFFTIDLILLVICSLILIQMMQFARYYDFAAVNHANQSILTTVKLKLFPVNDNLVIQVKIILCVFSPTSDGSGAAIIASEDFVKRHGLENQAVEILAMEMSTDLPSVFDDNSCIKAVCIFMIRFILKYIQYVFL